MKRAKHLLTQFMKLSLVQIFLACLFFGMSWANDLSAQELLNRRLSIQASQKKIKAVLGDIEKATDVRFSYSPQIIRSNRTVTLNVQNATLGEVLDQLLKPLQITYNVAGRQIILINLPPKPAPDHSGDGAQAPAQSVDRDVTGKITDEKGAALPGVSVVLKGTSRGTTTDGAGTFRLTIPNEGATLVFSFVGYVKQEVAVGNETSLSISLAPDAQSLSEIVVVGYGTQSKASLTGAVGSVKGEAIASIPTAALSNTLAGRVPGVNVVGNSGFVGAPSTIQIRGVGSFNNTAPLYVIDGIVQSKALFDALAPNEVESISILKDAATASIYGARGANGVVLVKTKSGKAQKPVFSYSTVFSAQRTTRPLQSYSATEELQYINDQAETFGNPKPITQEIFDYFKDKSYSILDQIWQNPTSQQHDFSVNGGSENISYYMLTGFNKSMGSFKNTDYGRYNFRSNVTAKINDYMSVNLNVSGTQRESDRFYWPYDEPESYTIADFYRATFNWTRLYPFYVDAQGKPTDDYRNGFPVSNGGWNPVELVQNGGYRRLTYRTLNAIGRFDLKIPFIDGLSTSFQYNYTASDRNAKDFILFNKSYKFLPGSTTNRYLPGPIDPGQVNVHNLSSSYDQVVQNASFDKAYQLNWFLNYARTFGAHHVTGLLAYEQQKAVGNALSGSAQDLLSREVDQIFNASTDRTKRTFDGNEYHNARASWVGRAHYEYRNKYIAEFSFRYDGSYIFPENSRWGFFPSGSAAWVLSEEKFFKVPVISFLKVRGSVGLLGDDGAGLIAAYQAQTNYRAGLPYVFGTSVYNGIQAGTPPNLNITWEKALSYNAGIDFGLLNGKLTGEVDYFYRHTYDILGQRIRVIPGTYGANLSSENYAQMDVKGFEAALTYNNRVGNVRYSVGANMGYARDKVVLLDEAAGLDPWRSAIGHPRNRVMGYVSDGIIRDQATLEALPASFTQFGRKPMLGTILYKDIRGTDWSSDTPDGKITEYDQVYLSDNGIPRLNYGITLFGEWKGLSLDVLFQGVGAYDRMISTLNGGGVFQTGDRPYFALWTDHWTPDNPDAPYPRAGQWSEEFGPAPSTFWLKNGAYMRLRNITLAYNLPLKWISTLKMQSCRVYLNGGNLFVISPIKVMDPEQNTLDSYPLMKTFSAGLTVNF
ncbi:TonB-linked SusC/RagA family outer membrane protein [Larkinella arboricola]|uniref:TonB-linked SusC/RagA family outer membrane protein n=2 Tax=Larkinella arboricola TaxID=643671 RepID=A0A327XC44_LARAB|nr:TonB-linked SusC/RagA family outer membrane protein [Larkinella arboricola]